MNTLFLTLKDKIIGYKNLYENALINSSELYELLSTIRELDVKSEFEDIILSDEQITYFRNAFNRVNGFTLSLPGSNQLINLQLIESDNVIDLTSSGSEIIRIVKDQKRLIFGQSFTTLNSSNTIGFDEFCQGVTDSFILSDVLSKLASYSINPKATIDGACAMIRNSLNGSANVLETCDTLEQYFVNSPDPSTAMLGFMTDQQKSLNALRANDTNQTISFDDDYTISNTFSIPLKIVGQVASAILSGIVAIFNPVLGAITYAASYAVDKVVDFVRENLNTSAVTYLAEHDTPTYAQPLFQFKQNWDDTYPFNVRNLLGDLSIDLHTDWIVKFYWYGVCCYIWSSPKEQTISIEGYLIPLWYPVREGGGNEQYTGSDNDHTLKGFWNLLTRMSLPVKFSTDSNNLPQFHLEVQQLSSATLQSLWDLGEISPSKFSELSEYEKQEAIKQSMFWWGLLMVPSIYTGVSTHTPTSEVSYNPKELYNNPLSYAKHLWKMAFAISISSMMDWDYTEQGLSPLFNLQREWNVLTSFSDIQNYLIAFKSASSKLMNEVADTSNSTTALFTAYAAYGILNNNRVDTFIIGDFNCKGLHLLYPPQYTHKVWMQAIVMLITTAAIITGAVVVKKVIVKKIRAAVLKQRMKLQAQQQQLLYNYMAGNYNPNDAMQYLSAQNKFNRWNRMLNLGKYDITNSTNDNAELDHVTDFFADMAKTKTYLGKLYAKVTGSDDLV